jgi:hypothetical protein
VLLEQLVHLLGELFALEVLAQELVAETLVLEGEFGAIAVGILLDLFGSLPCTSGFALVGYSAAVVASFHL